MVLLNPGCVQKAQKETVCMRKVSEFYIVADETVE